VTTIVLFAIALAAAIMGGVGNYAYYINKLGIVRPIVSDTFIIFSFMMFCRSAYLVMTFMTTETGSAVAASIFALFAFIAAVATTPYSLNIGLLFCAAGLMLFALAWRSEHKIPQASAEAKDGVTNDAPTSATNAGHTAVPDDDKIVAPYEELTNKPTDTDRILRDYGAALNVIRFCMHCGRRTTPRHSQFGEFCGECGNKY